jgi:hypothetical protein
MRGSPLLQLLGLAIALMLLGFPLHYITSAAPDQTPPVNVDTQTSDLRQLELKLVSSSVPYTFEIRYLGKPLWTGTGQRTTETKIVQIPFPAEGIDLGIDAHWTTPGKAALQLTVGSSDQPPLSHTVWGDGKISDTVTFKEGSQ